MQVHEFMFCVPQPSSRLWFEAVEPVELAFSTFLCLLATVRFATQSLQMYRVTGKFQLSRYMNVLVREGVLYFLVYDLVFLFPFH